MKYFYSNTKVDGWNYQKYNWVDDNNVLVGYSDEQCCCENVGYWYKLNPILDNEIIYDTITDDIEESELETYNFDPTYNVESFTDITETYVCNFKLVSEGKPDVYLVLYNYHNGYYAHGFDMCKGEIKIFDGSI